MIYYGVVIWVLSCVAWFVLMMDEGEVDHKTLLIMFLPIINTGALFGYFVNWWLTKRGDD